jgi:hypothetical protein
MFPFRFKDVANHHECDSNVCHWLCPIVSGKLKDCGTENTSTKRKRVSLESGKRLTRLRFVLELLARQDVKEMTENWGVRSG